MELTLVKYLRSDDGLVFRALTEAIYSLLQNRSIDELSISELVMRAGISRASFYRHFRDKYDLVSAIHMRVLEGTLLTYFDGRSFHDAVNDTWQVFTRHKRFYRNALISTDVNSLGNFIFAQTFAFYQRALKEKNITMTACETRLLRQYTFGSVALLSEWILGDMDEDLGEYMRASIIGLPDFVREIFD
ncbi:MAG: TetR/AcrR family transcriptional regulator [Clostridia bacterium]|nr:TetR/AcrR family transcriptional regulator [Clostridia bacterium]